MERTDTERFAGRTSTNPGGERQRVLIARALAQEADHPAHEASSFRSGAGAGDLPHADRLRQEQGLTFVTVSHDLNLVGAFCSRVVLLRDGGVLASNADLHRGESLGAFGVVGTAAGPNGRVVQW
jgi:iron complex transport system ATP-binding protein